MMTPTDTLRLQDAVNRRVFLSRSAGGLGATALATLLGRGDALAATDASSRPETLTAAVVAFFFCSKIG